MRKFDFFLATKFAVFRAFLLKRNEYRRIPPLCAFLSVGFFIRCPRGIFPTACRKTLDIFSAV